MVKTVRCPVMRHVWSLIAAVVIAPLAWLLVALGQEESGATVTRMAGSDTFNAVDLVKPACFLAAAGLIIGLIATLRTSPIGALIGGLFYAGTYLALFIQPWRVHSAVPARITGLGQTVHPRVPLDNGTLLILGLLLLTAVVSAQRWRAGRPAVPAEVATDTGSDGGMPVATSTDTLADGSTTPRYQDLGATTVSMGRPATAGSPAGSGFPYGSPAGTTAPFGSPGR